MKSVKYKIANERPYKIIEEQLKIAGVGIAIDHAEEDGTVVDLYLLDGANFTPELILQLGVVIGTISCLHTLKS